MSVSMQMKFVSAAESGTRRYAYGRTDLMEWLLQQRRTDFSFVPDACSEYY